MAKAKLRKGQNYSALNPDGTRTIHSEGDVVEVTDLQLQVFKDVFELVGSETEAESDESEGESDEEEEEVEVEAEPEKGIRKW